MRGRDGGRGGGQDRVAGGAVFFAFGLGSDADAVGRTVIPAGCAGFIGKPFELDAFEVPVAEILNGTAVEAGASARSSDAFARATDSTEPLLILDAPVARAAVPQRRARSPSTPE